MPLVRPHLSRRFKHHARTVRELPDTDADPSATAVPNSVAYNTTDSRTDGTAYSFAIASTDLEAHTTPYTAAVASPYGATVESPFAPADIPANLEADCEANPNPVAGADALADRLAFAPALTPTDRLSY